LHLLLGSSEHGNVHFCGRARSLFGRGGLSDFGGVLVLFGATALGSFEGLRCSLRPGVPALGSVEFLRDDVRLGWVERLRCCCQPLGAAALDSVEGLGGCSLRPGVPALGSVEPLRCYQVSLAEVLAESTEFSLQPLWPSSSPPPQLSLSSLQSLWPSSSPLPRLSLSSLQPLRPSSSSSPPHLSLFLL
jgi:hypothetical protein